MSGSNIVLPQKDPESVVNSTWDFGSLTSGTLTGATSTISVWSGVDPNPSAVLDGQPVLQGGTICTQGFIGGLAGVIYKIRIVATSTDQTSPSIDAYLAVVEDPL